MTPSSIQRGLRVDDILGRNISVQWTEAIALVGAACRQVVATGMEGFPAASQVVLCPDGAVAVLASSDQHAVRGAAQLLTSFLADDVPVRVRLMLSQATATDVAYTSLKEFSDALAYFERPGGDIVLQALYARAAAASPSAASEPPRSLDAVAPLPAPDQPKPARRPGRAKSKPGALKIAVTAVTILIIGFASAWYASGAGIGDGKRDVSTIARQTSDAVESAVVSGLSAVTELSGLGRLVSADEAGVESPAAPEAPVKSSRGNRARAQVSPPPEAFAVFDLGPVPTDSVETPISEDPTAVPVTEFIVVEVYGEPPTYSPQSEGVTPPVAVRPQLPSELPSSLTPDQLYRVELIVTEDGTVDSVKLLGMPHTVHDFMFLSAAKAWQFHPALKDGVPVRYRKTVWIASQ